MTDIRPALRDRLASIKQERAELAARIQRLSELEKSVAATLAYEDALYQNGQAREPEFALHPTGGRGSVADFLVEALHGGPKTLNELKALPALSRYVKEGAQPGRTINFALVGLQKGNHVERLENGAWKLVSGEGRK